MDWTLGHKFEHGTITITHAAGLFSFCLQFAFGGGSGFRAEGADISDVEDGASASFRAALARIDSSLSALELLSARFADSTVHDAHTQEWLAEKVTPMQAVLKQTRARWLDAYNRLNPLWERARRCAGEDTKPRATETQEDDLAFRLAREAIKRAIDGEPFTAKDISPDDVAKVFESTAKSAATQEMFDNANATLDKIAKMTPDPVPEAQAYRILLRAMGVECVLSSPDNTPADWSANLNELRRVQALRAAIESAGMDLFGYWGQWAAAIKARYGINLTVPLGGQDFQVRDFGVRLLEMVGVEVQRSSVYVRKSEQLQEGEHPTINGRSFVVTQASIAQAWARTDERYRGQRTSDILRSLAVLSALSDELPAPPSPVSIMLDVICEQDQTLIRLTNTDQVAYMKALTQNGEVVGVTTYRLPYQKEPDDWRSLIPQDARVVTLYPAGVYGAATEALKGDTAPPEINWDTQAARAVAHHIVFNSGAAGKSRLVVGVASRLRPIERTKRASKINHPEVYHLHLIGRMNGFLDLKITNGNPSHVLALVQLRENPSHKNGDLYINMNDLPADKLTGHLSFDPTNAGDAPPWIDTQGEHFSIWLAQRVANAIMGKGEAK